LIMKIRIALLKMLFGGRLEAAEVKLTVYDSNFSSAAYTHAFRKIYYLAYVRTHSKARHMRKCAPR